MNSIIVFFISLIFVDSRWSACVQRQHIAEVPELELPKLGRGAIFFNSRLDKVK